MSEPVEPADQPAPDLVPDELAAPDAEDTTPRDVLEGVQRSPEEYGRHRAEQARQAAQPGPQGEPADTEQ